MKITRLDDDGGRKVLQAEAEWAGIAADYDDIVSAYSRVQIPGFRPGKVPRSVIEQRLQKEILDDLSQNTAQRLCREALRESGDEAMGPIEIKDIMCAKGKPFRFTARFWPMPEIALPDFGSLVVQEGGSDPRDQISHRLLEMSGFTVPDDMVKAELGDEDTDIRSDDAEWKAASDRVRLLLILKRIAAKEGIEASGADVEQRIKEKAIEFNTDPDVLRTELAERGGRQRLKDMLLAESILEYLIERSVPMKGEHV